MRIYVFLFSSLIVVGGAFLPTGFRNILHPAYRDADKVYINGVFLHAALSAAIPLDDGIFERNFPEAEHM